MPGAVVRWHVARRRFGGSVRSFHWLAALLLVTAITGCEQQPKTFTAVDITGAPYAKDFALTDHTGKQRTLADFRGKTAVVFFGFTQCPDVCPTTLSDMAEVKKKLGADGKKLEVLFISVDPERDTPALLAQYVPAFDPAFIGLTGTPEQIAATAREFKVFFQKVPGRTEKSYTVDHTAASFVFDPQGNVRLFVRYGTPVDAVVADLKNLL